MMKMKVLHRFRTFLYSIYFNFRVLPWKQAVHLPFCCLVRPTIKVTKGVVKFEGTPIKKYMVKLGVTKTPILNPRDFIWINLGTIVFKGKVLIGHHVLISVHKEGYLEFGDQVGLNTGCRVICKKRIIFGHKVRASWDCQFYDTNFHPLIDMVSEKPIKMHSPIVIGDNVWLGHNVIISKGVKLGNGSVVSSGSVVKSIFREENCIIAGNPAIKVDEGYKADFPDFK